MAVDDLWRLRDGSPSKRDGRGKRWRVRVEGYPSTLHRTRKEGERVELERLQAGPPKPASTVTVGELLDKWLAGKAGLSANGYAACKDAAKHVRAEWGGTVVSEVRRSDVVEWIAALQVQPPGRPSELRPAAGSTKAKALQALSGAMEVAIDRGLVDANPCRKVSAGPQARRAVVALRPAELAALADAAGEGGPMVRLLGTCGPRISEACRLDVGDVDARRGRVMLRKTKGGVPREVPIPASVLALLDLDRPRDAPLFIAPAGGRVSVHNWRARVLAPAAAAIGRPDVTPHVLRHTAASLAIESGADVKAVQRMLGHTSAKLTLDTYSHLWDARLDDVAAAMDRLLTGRDSSAQVVPHSSD